RRLNYERSGFRSLIMKTARRLASGDATQKRTGIKVLGFIDKRWLEPTYWQYLKSASRPYTPFYLLSAIDMKLDKNGHITTVDEDKKVYVDILMRTISIAFVVTFLCLILGYPLAALMTRASKLMKAILWVSIMLPFWSSLLARTTAWIVMLQNNGVLNNALSAIGIKHGPLDLMFNRAGVYIVMVHILLPFAVVPIYNNLKSISPHLMKASASLGAHPIIGFFRVYLPLSLPGISAAAILTFIISIGYYITPSLVGNASDQMLGYFVAFYANQTVNWGMASALGVVLLVCVIAVLAVTAGISRLFKFK
ncbi:ABC transporter permease, partial [Vibrio sp. Vb339]|uniref:ABC transporter permease n=1 Tax=Vibrio sp. Vb339 TaxID=1192013 RepID=UPI001C12DBA3